MLPFFSLAGSPPSWSWSKAFIINKNAVSSSPGPMSSFYFNQPSTHQPVLPDPLTYRPGVRSNGLLELFFIRGPCMCAKELVSPGRWSGRAKRWRRRTPCRRGGSWGTDAPARTSGVRLVAAAPARRRRCLFRSTGRWTRDPPRLPRWMQSSYISHRPWQWRTREAFLVHIQCPIAYCKA